MIRRIELRIIPIVLTWLNLAEAKFSPNSSYEFRLQNLLKMLLVEKTAITRSIIGPLLLMPLTVKVVQIAL